MAKELGQVKINGKYYRIDPASYRDKDLADFSPRSATPGGSVIMSELLMYQPQMQTDWRHGFGFIWYEDALGYMKTIGNIDTRQKGIVSLYTAAQKSDTDIYRKEGFIQYKDYLFSWGENGIRRYESSDKTWDDVYSGKINYMMATDKYLVAFPDGERPVISETGEPNEGSKARLFTNLAGNDNDLLFVAKTAGTSGNNITIAYVDDPSNPDPPTVSVTGNAITVNIDAGVTTATKIKTAIENDTNASALVNVYYRSWNNGSGVVPVMPPSNLTGGSDNGIAAEYTTQLGGNKDIKFTAIKRGSEGNKISISYQLGAPNVGQEYVVVAKGKTTVVDVAGTINCPIGDYSGTEYQEAQSFRTAGGKLVQFTVYLNNNSGTPSGNIDWEVRSNNNGDPGNVLAAGTFTPVPGSNNVINAADANLILTAEETYWLVLKTNEQPNNTAYNWAGNSANPYPEGVRKYSTNNGTTWIDAATYDMRCSFTTSDSDAEERDITVVIHPDSTAVNIINAVISDTPAYAEASTALTTPNSNLIFTAAQEGMAGNDISVIYQLGAPSPGQESVSVSGDTITVTIHKDTKAIQIKQALEQSTSASALITVSLPIGSSGLGTVVPPNVTTWSLKTTLKNGSILSANELIRAELAPGSDGSGKPGMMPARMLQGGSGLLSWRETGRDKDAKDFRWAIIHNGFLYAGKDDSNIIHSCSAEDLSDLEGSDDEPNAIPVGGGNYPTLGAIVYAASLFIAKPDGLWALGEDRIARKVLDYTNEVSENNFRSMAIHNGYLVYPIRNKFYQWNGSRISDITPPRINDNFPYVFYTNYDNLVVVGSYLYTTAITNETSYTGSMLCFDGVGWHKLSDLITNGDGNISAMGYDVFNECMWFHVDNTTDGNATYYIQFQDNSDYPYPYFPTTGTHEIEFSRWDAGYRRVIKSSPSLLVEAQNLSPSNYLEIYYSIDGGPYIFWDTITSNGITEITNPGGNRTIEFYYIVIKVKFITSNPSETPILEGITLRFLMRPDTFYGYSMFIYASSHYLFDGQEDSRTAREIIEDLRRARDSKAPIEFIDINGIQHYCYLTSITGQAIEHHLDTQEVYPDYEFVCQINLVEV